MLSNAMNRRTFLNGTLTAAATAALVGAPTGADTAGANSSATPLTVPLRIDTGRVSGVASLVSCVTVFKGLPYAATTAGANRWRPPQRADSWTGVRVADTFGDICPQQVMGSASRSRWNSGTASARSHWCPWCPAGDVLSAPYTG